MTNPTITVTDVGNKISATESNFSLGSPTEFDTPTQAKTQKSNLFIAAGIGIASQVIQNKFSRVGKHTGNQLKQNQINNSLKVVNGVRNLGLGFAAGGFIGLGVAGAYTGYKTYDEIQEYNFQIEEQNTQQEYIRSTLTFINSNNRGRGND